MKHSRDFCIQKASRRWLFSLLFAASSLPVWAAQPTSECTEARLTGQASGLCQSFCATLDCTAPENSDSAECQSLEAEFLAATGTTPPCKQTVCDFLDPALVFERILYIPNPEYVCYADSSTPYDYVEYIVESGGVPQIGFGLEDQFDGTWYGYYFEYQDGSVGALPEFYRYDLTQEQVEQCRQAFEPPWNCTP